MSNLHFCFVQVLFISCFLGGLGNAGKDLATDQSALLEFKARVTEDPQSILANNWSNSNPVCNWFGVTCSAHHRRVTALNLSHMELGGGIPPHLGNLSFLTYLRMEGNFLTGNMPRELVQLRRLKVINFNYNNLSGGIPLWVGNFSRLRYLGLYGNGFTGPIPHSLYNLSELMVMETSYNKIEGSIPSEFGKLPNLRILAVANNRLSGSIPAAIYNISSLRIISLENNALSGTISEGICYRSSALEVINLGGNRIGGAIPKSIKNCTSLTTLDLRMNYHLTGEIPHEIGNLQNLHSLFLHFNSLSSLVPSTIFNISTIVNIDLGLNKLTGYLPSSIGYMLPNIEYLGLGDNKLAGTIPNSICNASKLTFLELSYNKFTGLIPNNIGNLRDLYWLNLGNNNLTTESSTTDWSFLSSLTNCRKLRFLALFSNPLHGTLPRSIGNFSGSFQKLYAYDCKIKGGIPPEIGNLESLILLNVSYNELNETIPETTGRLRNLQSLDLQNNNLQGHIPYELCQLEKLDNLWLNDNMLNGPLPSCLGSLTSLRELQLGSNELTSSIPSSLWILEYILHVNLASNSLTGPIPSHIRNLKVLIELDLSRNQLSGVIPITVGDLRDLVTLSLADNRFQGPIPDSFGRLTSLESLDLSNNNLSGEIPMSLEALSHLNYFNVSINRLEGEIPTGGFFKNFGAQSFMGNYALCGSSRLQVSKCKDGTRKHSKSVTAQMKYVLPLVLSTTLVAIFIIVFIRVRHRRAKLPSQEELSPLAAWRRTSYLEIQKATNGFSEYNLIGTGGFGSVYKGTLSDGMDVAIKVFNPNVERAFKSFESECEVLRNIRHRNLIKIISSCSNIDFKALVLEYMPTGSLEQWLYSHNYFLDVLERLNIMIDVGSALEYLHHGHSTPVIHCDMKPSNILLDEHMVARVGDFGIAKLLGEGDTMTQTMTLATIGYMAPEYGLEGIVSSKGDVYSFGILLMETFTRKKPTDEMFSGDISLRQWVKESIPEAIIQIVDANLLTGEKALLVDADCISCIMGLALECSVESLEQRIDMKDAVTRLKKIKMKFFNDSREA